MEYKGIDLSGRIALVTGGAGEIGRVICRTLAAYGADVIVNYMSSEKKAEDLCEEIRGMGRRAIAIKADITNEESVIAMREKAAAELGMPDIIVNNALTPAPSCGPIIKANLDAFQKNFEGCVIQNVVMAKVFVPHMIEQKWGRVIAINTECAILCDPGYGSYSTAKKGMDATLRILAKEIGHSGVTVNQVAPGWTVTEKVREQNIVDPPEYVKRVPLGHRGCDQDIANAVAFFASEMSSFITGVYLPVSGGIVMPGL